MDDISDIQRGYIAGWWIGWSEKMARATLEHYISPRPCPLAKGPCRCAERSPDPDVHWN